MSRSKATKVKRLTVKKPVKTIKRSSVVQAKAKKSFDKTSSKSAPAKAGVLHSKRAPEPVGPYPHARRVGDFIFVSGMGPRRPGSKEIPGVFQNALGEVISYDIEIQTRSVIENIRMVLEDMGASLDDVIDVSVFLTAMKSDFKRFNKVYGEYFAKIGPTRTTVEVLSLPTPIAVELKVIAHRK